MRTSEGVKKVGGTVEVAMVRWRLPGRKEGWDDCYVSQVYEALSMGIIVDTSAEALTLSTSKTAEGKYVDPISIPKSSIIQSTSMVVPADAWIELITDRRQRKE